MKSKLSILTVFVIGIIFIGSVLAFAADEPKTVKGKLVCIGCTLKSESGANSSCSVYGHKHGFQTEDGSIYSFVENDKTSKLITDMKDHDAAIEVTGIFFHNAHYIDVVSYKILK